MFLHCFVSVSENKNNSKQGTDLYTIGFTLHLNNNLILPYLESELFCMSFYNLFTFIFHDSSLIKYIGVIWLLVVAVGEKPNLKGPCDLCWIAVKMKKKKNCWNILQFQQVILLSENSLLLLTRCWGSNMCSFYNNKQLQHTD